jgi:hypothetical protein
MKFESVLVLLVCLSAVSGDDEEGDLGQVPEFGSKLESGVDVAVDTNVTSGDNLIIFNISANLFIKICI